MLYDLGCDMGAQYYNACVSRWLGRTKLAVMFGVIQRDNQSVTWSIIALVRLEAGMDPVYSCLGISKKEIQTRAASVPDLDW